MNTPLAPVSEYLKSTSNATLSRKIAVNVYLVKSLLEFTNDPLTDDTCVIRAVGGGGGGGGRDGKNQENTKQINKPSNTMTSHMDTTYNVKNRDFPASWNQFNHVLIKESHRSILHLYWPPVHLDEQSPSPSKEPRYQGGVGVKDIIINCILNP